MISAPHIHKTQNFENKLQKFIHEGLSRLQVITDFDNTLTYGFINGTRGHTTFGFLRESGYLDENYGEKSDALFWKYYTMWKDDSVEYEYKMKQMKNWIYEHGELLSKSGITVDIIKQMIADERIRMREGVKALFDLLEKNTVPITIVSAGFGNSIVEILKTNSCTNQNIHLISNILKFADSGDAVQFEGPIVSVMNKSEIVKEDPMFKSNQRERPNLLVIGDSIDDAKVAESIPENNKILIGFLNENASENLEMYLSKFDVVITDDGTLQSVNDIVNKICMP